MEPLLHGYGGAGGGLAQHGGRCLGSTLGCIRQNLSRKHSKVSRQYSSVWAFMWWVKIGWPV